MLLLSSIYIRSFIQVAAAAGSSDMRSARLETFSCFFMTQKTRNYLQPKKDFARALSVIYQTKLMAVLKKKAQD
jgi:hypothetical protein